MEQKLFIPARDHEEGSAVNKVAIIDLLVYHGKDSSGANEVGVGPSCWELIPVPLMNKYLASLHGTQETEPRLREEATKKRGRKSTGGKGRGFM